MWICIAHRCEDASNALLLVYYAMCLLFAPIHGGMAQSE